MATAAAPAPQPTPPPQAQQQQQPSKDQQHSVAVNATHLKDIGDHIRTHLRGRGGVLPIAEFAHLVYAFARGIDFAVSAGDIPAMAGEIPGILRKVYELKKQAFVQSSFMVLVIACKNACSNNWFQPSDSRDIFKMANELSGIFCTSSGQEAGESTVLEIISQVMPRYYPRLKFERLITSIEAKVGYDVLMVDFFIERTLSRDENIRLIVVQKENLDTSSCITSPPYVSFLVNGKGVDKRTNVSMDVGPQFPSDITKMLKYGANIIQAVGYFNANYIIAVAFVNSVTSFSAPKLDVYAQPTTVCPADSDVLEGPSRVPLNCPISFRRIKTPIKGRLCKHYQCFDYYNYMEMNSRKPNWRCPYCNTPSNFSDLRIDQKMTKILQETGDDVIEVLVFADGSWKAAPAHDEKSVRHRGDAIEQTGYAIETDSSSSDVIDLIHGDADLPMDWASTSEDTKPLLNGLTSGLSSSSFGTLESILPQNVLRPVITAAVSPSLETSSSTSGMQLVSQEIHRETVQLQPQIGTAHGSEARRLPIPRNPRREPVGVQALPVPPQNPGSSTRLQPNILNCPPPIPLSSPASSTYQAHQMTNPDSVIAPINNGGVPLPRTPSAAASLHLQPTTRNMRNTSSHLPSRVVGLIAPHLWSAQPPPGIAGQAGGVNTYRPTPMQQTPALDQLMHTRMAMNQAALAAAGQTAAAGHAAPTPPSLQRVPPHLQPTSVPSAAPGTPQAGSSDGLPPELPVDENWCPTGRMRGSLTGNAYNSALRRYLPQQEQQEGQPQAHPSSALGARRPH